MPAARDVEFISPAILAEAIGRAPDNRFIIWTGHCYSSWQRSLRSRALALIKEVGKPVALRDLMRRAARIEGERGYDPDVARSGVRLHQGSKPAVYLLVERGADGDYRAVTSVPYAGPALRRLSRGEVVMDRQGRLHIECLQ